MKNNFDTNSKEVKNFISKAEIFCYFMEDEQKISSENFFYKTYRSLLELYVAYQDLPDGLPHSNMQFIDLLPEKDYNKVARLIAEKVGHKYDTYRQAFDPIDKDDEDLGWSALWDDFGDIYRDLKRCSLVYKIGNDDARGAALFEIKIGITHWGHHTINALRALHYLVHEHMGKGD